MSGLSKSHIPSLKQIYSGKVRDCYAVGEDKLLLVASDRISAFDVILGDPIPGKGKVLTALTNFWFEKLKDVIPNHLTGIAPESVVKPEEVDQVKGRAVVSKRLKPILIECVARGYIIGGGWKDYLATGKVCGVELPAGLKQAQKLPEPIFTPAACKHFVHQEYVAVIVKTELEFRVAKGSPALRAAGSRDSSRGLLIPRRPPAGCFVFIFTAFSTSRNGRYKRMRRMFGQD